MNLRVPPSVHPEGQATPAALPSTPCVCSSPSPSPRGADPPAGILAPSPPSRSPPAAAFPAGWARYWHRQVPGCSWGNAGTWRGTVAQLHAAVAREGWAELLAGPPSPEDEGQVVGFYGVVIHYRGPAAVAGWEQEE